MEIGIDFFKKGQETAKKEKLDQPKALLVEDVPSLDVLERDAYAVKIFSPILNDYFVVFKKGYYARTLRKFPDDILYYEKEVRNLIKLSAGPEELKLIHAAKRIFREGCWLTEINPPEAG